MQPLATQPFFFFLGLSVTDLVRFFFEEVVISSASSTTGCVSTFADAGTGGGAGALFGAPPNGGGVGFAPPSNAGGVGFSPPKEGGTGAPLFRLLSLSFMFITL